MRILFFNPATGYYTRAVSNPLGLLCIASFLQRKGHVVKIVDRCVENIPPAKIIKEFSPDIVGLSIMSGRGLNDSKQISDQARRYGIPVYAGGYFPTLYPELILESGIADVIVCGEGEYTFAELAECDGGETALSKIKGIAYIENGKTVKTEDRPFADLGDFSVLDWSLIKPQVYFQKYFHCNKMLYLYSSKGCPGQCAFCSNHYYNKSTFRKRPNEYVVADIKNLIENYGADGIYFTGELWCLNKKDAYDFCERIKKEGLKFSWGMLARIGQYSREDFELFYDSGCRFVCFGVETGSPEMQKVLKKKINLEKAKETLTACKETGITSIVSYMIGIPGETEEDLRQTIGFIETCDASINLIYLFTLIENTEIYDDFVKSGRIAPQQLSIEVMSGNIAMENPGTNFSHIPDKDLMVIKSYYDWKAFAGKRTVNGTSNYAFAGQTVVNGIKTLFRNGVSGFFRNGFTAAMTFMSIFRYSHFETGILRKYGLK